MPRCDLHEYPLAERLIRDVLVEWLTTRLAIAKAAAPSEEARNMVDQVAHLHLAGTEYSVVPQIVDVLVRAGLLDRRPASIQSP